MSRMRNDDVWGGISRKPFEIETSVQRTTNKNDPSRVQWSRDRWRHVTLKGQGCDPNMLRNQYHGNSWKKRLGNNWAPTGNGYLGIKWSRDRWRHVTLKGQRRDPNTPSLVTLGQGVDFWYQFSIMTARFVFQTASPVREQSVQNVVFVHQNPLEQIVVHIFNEFGCCQDIGTAQSRSHTPADNCLQSLPIRPPPP